MIGSITDIKKYGTRKQPRKMLTAEAAIKLCKRDFRAIWVRLPMYPGVFHIFPGGRKEFYPDNFSKRIYLS